MNMTPNAEARGMIISFEEAVVEAVVETVVEAVVETEVADVEMLPIHMTAIMFSLHIIDLLLVIKLLLLTVVVS